MSAAGDGGFMDPSMLELFCAEAEAQAAALNEGLLRIERDPADSGALESLMRAAHSIKGAARIVQLEPAVRLAHAMEDCFSLALRGEAAAGRDLIDLLFQSADLFAELSKAGGENIQTWLAGREREFAGKAGDLREALERGGEAAVDPKTASAPREAPPDEPPAAEDAGKPAPAAETPEPSAPGSTPGSTPGSAPGSTPAPDDRPVRVSGRALQRLLNLTGGLQVEIRQLSPFSRELLRNRRDMFGLDSLLRGAAEAIEAGDRPEAALSNLREAVKRAERIREASTELYAQFENLSRRFVNLANRLYGEAVDTRMRPFGDCGGGFPRMIRDIARQLGKKIRLEIRGADVRVDRDILAMLEAPLAHLLRNSADHGIEPPEERRAAGKDEEGLIVLEAGHHAGILNLSVRDDGRGVDPESVRRRVAERGLAPPEIASKLIESELMEFLLLPGFTTSSRVTEISGRGFGLDVVRGMAQRVGGAVTVRSRKGKGLEVRMKLPLTLSIVRALVFEIAGEPYAVPLARLDGVLKTGRGEIRTVEGKPYIVWDNENVGLVSGRQILEIEEEGEPPDPVTVVLLNHRGTRYGFVTGRLRGERNLVVRPLDPRLGRVPCIHAASILPDGSPVLILDADDVAGAIEKLLARGSLRGVDRRGKGAGGARRKRVLVVDDSLTVREVERKLLENNGYEVTAAVDGMDGWNTLRRETFDLVITDVDMPRMNGIELVRRIKGDPGLRDVPVMIVSYKDREEDRRLGLDAGANYYVAKSSFHDETLLGAVVDLIGKAPA